MQVTEGGPAHTDASRIHAYANRIHAYAKTVGIAAAAAVGDSRLMVADAGLRIVRVLVLLAIWRTLVAPGETVSGFTLPDLLTYTLIAEIFAEQLQAKSELDGWLWEGTLASRMQAPMSLVGQLASHLVGSWVFGFVAVSVPVLALAPLFGVNPLPASASAGLTFAPSLALAVAIGLAVDVILAALTVAYGLTVWLVGMLRAALFGILSGAVIPLAVLPWGLGAVFGWLPFASMASAPLRIYTGTGSVATLLCLQAGWAVVLWLVAGQLWRTNRERLVGHGG